MAVTKKSARQCVEVATCDFTYADVTSGTYAACVDLPLNAIVTKGELYITTLFNSGTDDKFSIGDQVGSESATADTYAAITAGITATGRAVEVVPTGIKTTAATTVGVVWTATGTAATAGVGKLVIEYIVDGRAESSFEG
jgi:hypothetical protein